MLENSPFDYYLFVMKRRTRTLTIVVSVILLIPLLVYLGLCVVLYSSVGGLPVDETTYPSPQIQELIWPTLGYPALVTPGDSLEVEIDPGGEQGFEPDPLDLSGWRALIKPVRKALSGLVYSMKATKTWKAVSDRWPRGTSRGSPNQVWHVEFEVPEDVVPELYDISIEVHTASGVFSDGEPHAVSVMEEIDDSFTFISLSDIHVHERDISTIFQKQTNEGISPDGEPIFFNRAIEQVNLIRPDFVVMLGDYVRAQRRTGQYQVEFEHFYREALNLEVPAFMLPGNHDQYYNQVDGKRVWEENIGPLHYSFDIGDCHFTCINPYDWSDGDRIVMEKLGLIGYPRKWQAQILGAEDEKEESTYTGQLAWIRDDLSSNQEAPLRLMLTHMDPYTVDGNGDMFNNETFGGIFSLGGGGKGREALKGLASRHRVDMVFSGHLHHDNMGSVPWADGDGETVYANQTCVYYDEGGVQEKYPGYRLIEVEDAKVKGCSYLDGVHSMPFYDGSVLDGDTDLDHLDRPAFEVKTDRTDGTGSFKLEWDIKSYLGVPLELRGLIATAPTLPGGYQAEGGEIYQVVEIPGGEGNSLLYVRTTAEKGVPGKSATKPGKASETIVTVR